MAWNLPPWDAPTAELRKPGCYPRRSSAPSVAVGREGLQDHPLGCLTARHAPPHTGSISSALGAPFFALRPCGEPETGGSRARAPPTVSSESYSTRSVSFARRWPRTHSVFALLLSAPHNRVCLTPYPQCPRESISGVEAPYEQHRRSALQSPCKWQDRGSDLRQRNGTRHILTSRPTLTDRSTGLQSACELFAPASPLQVTVHTLRL